MFKVRNLATLLALSSVAVLPACSMFGGGDNDRRRAAPPAIPARATHRRSRPPTHAGGPMSQDTIRQVQQALQQAGMYRARVDGVWGPATEAAVRSYQQKHNLNASGELDSDTLASLNLGNATRTTAASQPPTSDQPATTSAGNLRLTTLSSRTRPTPIPRT